MKIVLFIESLSGAGGAERVAVLIPECLIKIDYTVYIIVLDDGKSFYTIPIITI